MNAKTDTAAYEGHRIWYVASLTLSLIGLIVATIMVAHTKHVPASWELNLFHHLNNASDTFRLTAIAITMIGGSVWAALASIIIATAFRMYRLAWRLSAVIIGGYGLDFILKQTVDRGRPGDLMADFHRRSVETGAGFPSGHTTVATVISLVLLPYLPKAWRWIVAVWIILVGVSRIYLGVHLPLDVIGGFLVGVFVVSLTRVAPQPLRVFTRLD
ncbi:MAG: phosphatase PAP2 family protein [Candidatus Saccharibacteria bacterium]